MPACRLCYFTGRARGLKSSASSVRTWTLGLCSDGFPFPSWLPRSERKGAPSTESKVVHSFIHTYLQICPHASIENSRQRFHIVEVFALRRVACGCLGCMAANLAGKGAHVIATSSLHMQKSTSSIGRLLRWAAMSRLSGGTVVLFGTIAEGVDAAYSGACREDTCWGSQSSFDQFCILCVPIRAPY